MKAVTRYLPWVALPLAVFADSAMAATQYEETKEIAFMVEYDKGSDYQKFGAGFGAKPKDNALGFGGLYYQELSLTKSDLDVKTFGVRGFKVQPTEGNDIGVDLLLSVSHTTQEDYKRTGLGGRAAFYVPVWQQLTVFVGGELRPTFFSLDWGSSVLSETGFDAGLDWRLQKNFGIYTHYYYQGAIDDDLATHKYGSGVSVGFNLIW